MGSYTKINIEKAQDIINIYFDNKEISSLSALSLGISNSNYKIVLKSKEEYLLKISNDKDINELNREQKILSHLKKITFPIHFTPF